MNTKVKITIAAVSLATAFATGRWFTPTKIITKTVTIEVQSKSQNNSSDNDTDHHKETDTTEITKPDGTKETTTKIIDDTSHDKKTDQLVTNTQSTSATTDKEVTRATDKVTISVLAAVGVKNLSAGVSPGAMISKPILGPIAIGVFGLTNGTVGCSVGLSF